MYKTLQYAYYWPSTSVDVYNTVRNCSSYAKERVRARTSSTQLKLFPAASPQEDVAMDLLGELITTPRGKKNILVMTDRFTKLVRVVELSTTRGIDIARAFVRDWVFVYGPPNTILTDNGPQFTARFLLETHRLLGIEELFPTAYHPETNGQTERYNRTLLSALRKFCSDHPTNWDLYLDVVTYAYNTQVHESTGKIPFQLVLSRLPPSLFVEPLPASRGTHLETHAQWLRHLRDLVDTTKVELSKRQQRYKRAFDSRVTKKRRLRPPTP